jgi:glycerophosphoryl diester phosphodiesterase
MPAAPALPRLFYAHRGATRERPENTLAAFTRALELGATALETDAHLTADGHVVLSHDPTGKRMANVPVPIERARLDEVRAWDAGYGYVDEAGARPFVGRGLRMPTLEEVLEALPDVPLNVDAKLHTTRMADALVALLRRCKAQERVRVASFSSGMLRRIRALGYEGETGLGTEEVAWALFAPRLALRARPLRGHAAQIPLLAYGLRLDTRACIARLHSAGVRVDFWTVDDPAEARRLLALGADGIMTDDAAAIAPVFAAATTAPVFAAATTAPG